MRRLAAGVLLAATLLAGALGGTRPAGARAERERPDPCALLTRSEITRAFGQAAGKPSQSLGPKFCQWVLRRSATRGPGQVNTLLERGKAARRDFRLGEQLAGDLREPVEGLGKKAFFTPDTGTLFVLAPGPTLYYVQANLYAPDATRITDGVKDALTDLAARAETRV